MVFSSGNSEDALELDGNIVQILNNILALNPPINEIDDVYSISKELEVLLVCNVDCGEQTVDFMVGFLFEDCF